MPVAGIVETTGLVCPTGGMLVSYDHLDRPIQVGPHELRCRVYLPAHQPGLAEGGQVSDRYVAYHRQRAKAGVAMQVTGATPVAPSAEWAENCLWNVDESIVPGYRRLAAAVRAEGSRMLAQLAHPGPTEYEGVDVIGPSRDFSEVSRQVAVAATRDQLHRIVDQYAAAANRCRRGELDGIEISMAHGLLLAAFLSPLTNHRDDEYGGDFDRRLRLCLEVIDACRAQLSSDMILGIRLGADDLVEGGLRPAEAARIAVELQSEVDYISVMVGNNNRLEARVRHWPPAPAEPGLFREVMRTVSQAVNAVPVAGVGRILDLDLAEEIVASGDADLVGMVRAQIADPQLIPLSRAGNASQVRPCVGANVCVHDLLNKQPLHCFVNPDAGDSSDPSDGPSQSGRHVIVVGAGPAGLECARRLAIVGAEVELHEAQERLGGRLADWSRAPSRREFAKFIAWQRHRLEALGVDIHLGMTSDALSIARQSPDAVIVATGAPAERVVIPTDGSVCGLGVDGVFDPELARELAGTRVLVHDVVGELDAALIAEYLADAGARVTLSTARLHIGEGEGITTLYPMLRRLAKMRIPMVEGVSPTRIESGRVVLDGVFGGRQDVVEADHLVVWAGGSPDRTLTDELRHLGIRAEMVGDVLRPRRVTDAVADAKRCIAALALSE